MKQIRMVFGLGETARSKALRQKELGLYYELTEAQYSWSGGDRGVTKLELGPWKGVGIFVSQVDKETIKSFPF